MTMQRWMIQQSSPGALAECTYFLLLLVQQIPQQVSSSCSSLHCWLRDCHWQPGVFPWITGLSGACLSRLGTSQPDQTIRPGATLNIGGQGPTLAQGLQVDTPLSVAAAWLRPWTDILARMSPGPTKRYLSAGCGDVCLQIMRDVAGCRIQQHIQGAVLCRAHVPYYMMCTVCNI